jgi:DASS family divalent anion:Na+ symporter
MTTASDTSPAIGSGNQLKIAPFLLSVITGLVLWFLPTPEGLDKQAWHLFSVFVATIIAIILAPLPMGAVSLIAIAVCILTKTLSLQEALSGFGSNIAWLVVFAFFISRGFIKTGLGRRVAYFFISILGRNTLGLAYGMVLTEFLLSPMIPSVTARGGGIVFPIVNSLIEAYTKGHNVTAEQADKTAKYLVKVCFNCNVLTSTLFLTAMAGNPLIASLADTCGVKITWTSWAVGVALPGVILLAMLPLVIYMIQPPGIKENPAAPEIAKAKLKEMGRLSFQEIIMVGTFLLLIGMWIFGEEIGVDATTTALVGTCILLLSSILTWEDAVSEKAAWKTFFWFAILLMMSGFLTKLGMMAWLGQQIKVMLSGINVYVAGVMVCLFYFYIHYIFASITAHVTVMYTTFLLVLLVSEFPPLPSAMTLAVLSTLSGGLTHYGIGSAPIYFGAGYFSTRQWWRIGFIVSTLHLILWTALAAAWWKMIGWI